MSEKCIGTYLRRCFLIWPQWIITFCLKTRFQMTSRGFGVPTQWNGGHVVVPNQSRGIWKTFFCSNKFTKLLATWAKPLYSLFHPGLVLRNDLFNKKKIIFHPLNCFLDFLTSFLWSTKYLFKKDKHFAWSLPYRPQKWWQMKMLITQVRLLFPPQSFEQFCFHFFLKSQDFFIVIVSGKAKVFKNR